MLCIWTVREPRTRARAVRVCRAGGHSISQLLQCGSVAGARCLSWVGVSLGHYADMQVTGQLQWLYEPCNCADAAVLTPVSQTLATATATAAVAMAALGWWMYCNGNSLH